MVRRRRIPPLTLSLVPDDPSASQGLRAGAVPSIESGNSNDCLELLGQNVRTIWCAGVMVAVVDKEIFAVFMQNGSIKPTRA